MPLNKLKPFITAMYGMYYFNDLILFNSDFLIQNFGESYWTSETLAAA